MHGTTKRDFYLVLIMLGLLNIPLSISIGSLIVTAVLIAIGLVTWLLWHITSLKVSRIMILRDVRGKDTRLVSPAELSISPFGIKSLLKFSFLPALFAFSVVSLAYQILGLAVIEFMQVVYLLTLSITVLPFSIFIPAKWIIENSEITVSKSGEKFPREIRYFEYIDNFIDISAVIGFILIVAQVIVLAPSHAFGISVAILVMFFLILVSPSLLSTAIFFRFNFLKKVYRFRKSLKLLDANIHVEFRCPKCGSPISLDSESCTTCGKNIVQP